jgi:hypothetical protein
VLREGFRRQYQVVLFQEMSREKEFNMVPLTRSVTLALLVTLVARISVAQQLTQPELRQFTESALSRHAVSFVPPTLDWSGNTVRVDLGGVVSVSPAEGQPLDIALGCQFTVTGIRKYRASGDQKAFWTPVLAKAEVRISKMLDLIAAPPKSHDDLMDALSEQQGLFHEEIGASPTRLAKQYGKQGIAFPAPWRQWSVNVSTEPSGGTVKYIDSLRWDLYDFAKQRGKPTAEPTWATVVQNPVDLGGMYRFRVRWPDGTDMLIEQTEIKSAAPLVLRK